MKLTISDILNANAAISNIIDSGVKIKFQTAYDMIKIRDEFNKIEKYVADRMSIVGLITERGINPNETLQIEILKSEVDVDFEPLNINDLKNDKGFIISLRDVEKIKPILSAVE